MEAFLADGYDNITHLSSTFKDEELIDLIHDASIIGIRSNTKLNCAVLQKCNRMLAIGCFCIGTNQVDLQSALLKGIPVFYDPHSNTRSVAELVIGLSIALMRDLMTKNRKMHNGEWHKSSEHARELRGKIMGIVGYGSIGSQVSTLCESLGMQVLYYDIERKLSMGNAKAVDSLDELLSLSDIVTLHVPETELTKNLLDARCLSLMKPNAFLLNTSRGKVVDYDALAEVLKNKTIRGAGLDVFQEEPKDTLSSFKNQFQGLDNVILTPHIGGLTEEAQERIAGCVAHKLIDFINRGTVEGAANFPNLSLAPNKETHRILHIHENTPGILMEINKFFAEKKINILAQHLRTTEQIGYVVFDIEKGYKEPLIESLKAIKGTIRARILY